jgi:hypothetical protein
MKKIWVIIEATIYLLMIIQMAYKDEIGCQYKTPEEAIEAYKKGELKCHPEVMKMLESMVKDR